MKEPKNPNTTILFILAALGLLIPELQAHFDGDSSTVANWFQAVAAILMAGGGVKAADASKSGE